jgi:hypothetical protein
MRLEDIRQLTRNQPFQPFRIFLSNGETFDIHHPDMVVVSLGAAHVAAPKPGEPPDDPRNVRIISLVHIQKIEFLPPVNTQSNAGTPG